MIRKTAIHVGVEPSPDFDPPNMNPDAYRREAQMTAKHHELKVDPAYWEALESGDKVFEVRRNDRGYQRGDTVEMYATDCNCGKICDRVTRRLSADIGFVFSGDPRWKALEPGYVVFSLLNVRTK